MKLPKTIKALGLAGIVAASSLAYTGCVSPQVEANGKIVAVKNNQDSYDNSSSHLTEQGIDNMLQSAYKIISKAEYLAPGNNNKIVTIGAVGTGFVVKDSGDRQYILTCNHVVAWDDVTLHPVYGPVVLKNVRNYLEKDGTEYEVKLLDADRNSDAAVLKTNEDLDLESRIQLADKPIKIGDRVLAVGFPLNIGKFMTEGVISNVPSEETYLFYSAQIDPGYSGGPVFVLEHGVPRLAGLNRFMVRNSNGIFGATSVDYLKRLFENALTIDSATDNKSHLYISR
ncbi:MAG: serine protease [bacterium]|nr:serine protease [bacterium]